MPAARSEQSIFLAALELKTPEERSGYLKGACGDDATLLASVKALLISHENGDDFLEHPPLNSTEGYRPITEGPGTIIGPYKLLQQIGEGGFGMVYMAEQLRPVRHGYP
jgi:serine/threonine protein kinase